MPSLCLGFLWGVGESKNGNLQRRVNLLHENSTLAMNLLGVIPEYSDNSLFGYLLLNKALRA